MIRDNDHAASMQARYERHHHAADTPNPSPEFLTLAALAGLLHHFTGSDDGIVDELAQAARDCVNGEGVDGDEASASGLIAAWDYSDTPEAAVTYLATRLAPKTPANRKEK